MSQVQAPFALGTVEQYAVLVNQTLTPGSIAPLQWELPTAGYIARVRLVIGGTVTVSAAGSAGTPSLWNLISRYSLNVSFGFEYRGFEGDSLYFSNLVENGPGNNDPVVNNQWFQNYNPTSATQQTISMILDDNIWMNPGLDFDRFLIPYQNFSKKVYLQLIPCNNISAIYANTETINASAITVTPEITYQTVPADTPDVTYDAPDTTWLQQKLDERKLVNVLTAGAPNLVNLTPINGPEYLGLGFKLRLNGGFDPNTNATNLDHIRILANSTVQIFYMNAYNLADRAYRWLGRSLPAGWWYLPFSDDISLVNAMGPAERLVFSTQEYTQLDLEVTLKSGATVGSDNYVKLYKRLKSQAIPA